MKLTEIITAIVAIYGAALATYTYFSSKRIKIKVVLETRFLTHNPQPMFALEASNHGKIAVTLDSMGINIPGKNTVSFFPEYPSISISLPHELVPGKSGSIYINIRNLAVTLKNSGYSGTIDITGFYRDQLDRTFKSKKYKFNIDSWLFSS